MTKPLDIISQALKDIGALEAGEVSTISVKVINKTNVAHTQFEIIYAV